MLLSLAAVTDESTSLAVRTEPSLIYRESNLPSTSPLAEIRFLVTRLLVSTKEVLIIVSLEIAMPCPGKYTFTESPVPVLMIVSLEMRIPLPALKDLLISSEAIQVVPSHFITWPIFAFILPSLFAVMEVSASF